MGLDVCYPRVFLNEGVGRWRVEEEGAVYTAFNCVVKRVEGWLYVRVSVHTDTSGTHC